MLGKDDLTYYINYFYEKLKDEVSYEEKVSISLEAVEIFIMVGDFKSAKEITNKLLNSEEFSKYKIEVKYKILDMMHRILHKEGNLNEAVEILKKTLEIVGDSEELKCKAFVKLGNLHLKMGNFEEAKKYYTQAIYIGERLKEIVCLASAFNNVAIYHAIANMDHDKALMFLQKALSIYENVKPNSSITGRILANLGNLFKEKKMFGKAQDYYQKAHTIAAKLKRYDLLAHIYLGKSELYYEIGEYEVSRVFANKALNFYKLVNGKESKSWMADAYIVLAKISVKLNEPYESVKKMLDEAIGLVSEIGNWEKLVRLYELACDLTVEYGHKAEAEELLQKAIKISETHGLKLHIDRVNNKMNYIKYI